MAKTTVSSFIKKSLKHGAIYGLGDLLQKIVAFLLIPVYTRFLTPADYGVLELLGVTTSIIGLFIIHGMYAAFSRSYLYDFKDSFEEQRELLTTTYFYLMTSGILFLTALILLKKPINALLFKDNDYTLFLQIGFFTCALEAIRGFPFSIFRNNFQSIKFITLRMVGFCIGLFFNIYFVVFEKMGVLGILYANLITTSVICVIGAFLIKKYFVFRFSFEKLKPMLKFGIPFVPAGIAWFVFDISDRYFLQHFSSDTELGLYALGAKFAIIAQFVLLVPLQRVYFASYYPLAKDDPENARYILGRFLTYFCLAAGFVLIGIILFSEPAIKIMADKAFFASYKVVPMLAGSTVMLGLIHTLNAGINITGQTKYIPLMIVTSASANVGLNFILIPKYGMIGAAWATLCSYGLYLLLSFCINQKLYKREFEITRISKIIFATAIILSVGMYYNPHSIIAEISYDLLMLLLYPLLLLFILRFFNSDEEEMIRMLVIEKFVKKFRDSL